MHRAIIVTLLMGAVVGGCATRPQVAQHSIVLALEKCGWNGFVAIDPKLPDLIETIDSRTNKPDPSLPLVVDLSSLKTSGQEHPKSSEPLTVSAIKVYVGHGSSWFRSVFWIDVSVEITGESGPTVGHGVRGADRLGSVEAALNDANFLKGIAERISLALCEAIKNARGSPEASEKRTE